MPHLQYAGRFWRVASDELWLCGFCALFGRILWSILLIAAIVYSFRRLANCSDGVVMLFYLTLSIFVFFLSILCEYCIVTVSVMGTLVENKPRDEVLPKYLTLHAALGLLQFITGVFGFIVVFCHAKIPCVDEFDHAKSNVDIFILAFVVISQMCDTLGQLCCCFLFAANRADGRQPLSDNVDDPTDIYVDRIKMVAKSIQICTCNLFGGGNIGEDFELMARVLTNFFHHDGFLDVVPSDVVAGFVLVRREQQERKRRHKLRILTPKKVGSYGSLAEDIEGMKLSEMESGKNAALSPSSVLVGDCSAEAAKGNGGIGEEGTSIGAEDSADGYQIRPMLPSNAGDQRRLDDVVYFSIFAAAIYSHLLALFMEPVTGLCRLCCTRLTKVQAGQCCCCCLPGRSSSTLSASISTAITAGKRVVQGDNCCSINEAGVLQITRGNRHAELVFASFENNPISRPYAIFYDKKKDCVVIAVRGTLSLEDCVTDVTADTVEMSEAGEKWGFTGHGKYAHGGMLRSALHLRQEIEDMGILQKLMGRVEPAAGDFQVPLAINEVSAYSPQLVVVGHSLGAGTAVLLSMMLQRVHPSLRCVTYGTPGSIVDAVTARECSSFVTSCVLGDDLVCRLSLHTLARLREDVLDSIARARVSKVRIMQSIFRSQAAPVETLMHTGSRPPDSPFLESVSAFKNRIAASMSQHHPVELVIPGHIVHFQRVNKNENDFQSGAEQSRCCGPLSASCFSQPRYRVVENLTDHFREIELSPTMGWEHLPDQYYHSLTRFWEQWTGMPEL